MKSVRVVNGTAVPLGRDNVDTDQIIPARHLKRVERSGYGDFLFEAWRKDPDFILNDPRHTDANILIAGESFGSGSSREHAVWALVDHGFEAVIATSFADIFRTNAVQSGLLTIELAVEEVGHLLEVCREDLSTELTVDLESQTVRTSGWQAAFGISPSVKHRLLNGLDDISLTLQVESDIAEFEATRPVWLPTTSSS